MKMRHPKIEGVANVDPVAFEKVWKPKGWKEVTESPATPAKPTTLIDSDAEVVDEPDAPRPKKAATKPKASRKPEAKEEE